MRKRKPSTALRRRPATSMAVVAAAVGLVSLVGAPVAAGAPTNLTWTGATPYATGSGPGNLWSNGGNWTGPPPVPDSSLGTLTFPNLGSCSVAVQSCYSSDNDVSGLVAQAISLDDTDGYILSGEAIGLGSGGLTAAPSNTVNASVPNVDVQTALVLAANQSWSLNGNGAATTSGVALVGGVSGTQYTVDAHLGGAVGVILRNVETGAFTAEGATTTDTGFNAARNGTVYLGSLNASDGSPVTVDNVLLDAYDATGTSVGLGPLTANGAFVQVGSGNVPDTIASVSGGVKLTSGTVTQFAIDQGGSTPSTDYSQLKATGNVVVGGSLSLFEGSGGCNLGTGSTETLITTSGTVSGRFANAPNGGIVAFADCPQQQLGARITYSAHAVTATVVSGSTTATSLSSSRTTATTSQPVTLTAEVTTGSPSFTAPHTSDTVEFFDGTRPLNGCTAQPFTATAANAGSATCTTKLPAKPSPASLTARFIPSGTTLKTSTSPPVKVVIAK